MDIIYYVFRKDSGEFMGSGTPYFDDDVYGCTQIAIPEYDSDIELAFWNGSNWIIENH